jgi:phosphoserine phosphatase
MPESLPYALVLTAAPGSRAISSTLEAAAETLTAGVGQVLAQRWLAPAEALWIDFAAAEDLDPSSLVEPVRALVGSAPVDVNAIAADHAYTRRKLLVADMDSTLIEQECIDEMAAMLGLKEQISAITERAMNGELDFEEALRARLGLLKGLETAVLQQVFDQRISLMPGAATLVATMRANGAFAAIVSGGFTFFTSQVRAALGADVDHSNTLGTNDGKLNGDVIGPILGKDAKKAWLEHYRQSHGLHVSQTLAVGDGANDLAMLQAAGLGVAYRAKPVVAAQAQAAINHCDLTGLLYLQGYHASEFVTP